MCWKINGKNCEGVSKEWWLYAYKFTCNYAFGSVCRFLSVAIHVCNFSILKLIELQSKFLLHVHSVCICLTSLSKHNKLSCTEAKLISQVWRCRINHLQSSRNWESAHIQSCHSEHSSRTLSPDLWPFGSDGLSVCPDECKVRTWPPSGSGPPGGGKWREF